MTEKSKYYFADMRVPTIGISNLCVYGQLETTQKISPARKNRGFLFINYLFIFSFFLARNKEALELSKQQKE